MTRRTSGKLGQMGMMAAGAVIAIVAYEAGRARADGAPKDEPLVYSGYLTDDRGTPVADGERPFAVELFDTDAGGNSLCRTPAAEGVAEKHPVSAGHFSVTLDASCADAVAKNSDVWVEVEVSGVKMPRVKIAAVPYALEAERAKSLGAPAVADMEAAFATRECPLGFARDAADAEHVVCERRDGDDVLDRVVLVGTGRTSFWIDQYEASLWDSPDKNAKSYESDYPVTFPRNGQVTTKQGLLFARSVPGVAPSSSLTWFQASLGCMASGKRLPAGSEWQLAAVGTGDLKGVPSADCNIGTGLKRSTKAPMGCVSLWGAEDMIGNVGEMLGELRLSNNGGFAPDQKINAWGDDYGQAVNYGLSSWAVPEMANSVKIGLPAVEVRGGTFGAMNAPSVFQISASYAASSYVPDIGFRCVIPR